MDVSPYIKVLATRVNDLDSAVIAVDRFSILSSDQRLIQVKYYCFLVYMKSLMSIINLTLRRFLILFTELFDPVVVFRF
jgi:hypothetical protein